MSDVSSSTLNPSQMNHNDKPCHQRRRVCFSTETDDICYLRDVPPSSAMTDKERDSAWYTYEDMIQMKEEAKIVARRLRVVVSSKTSSNPPHSINDVKQARQDDLRRRLDEEYPLDFTSSSPAAIGENSSETFRGLELRIFIGRQVKKSFVARKIMKYQRKYKLVIAIATRNGHPNIRLLTEVLSNKLGYVSAKCSRWARARALVTGQSDFKVAYEQSENALSLSSLGQLSQIPWKRKRTDNFSSPAAKFEMTRCNKKQACNAHTPTGVFLIPNDGVGRDIIPVNVF